VFTTLASILPYYVMTQFFARRLATRAIIVDLVIEVDGNTLQVSRNPIGVAIAGEPPDPSAAEEQAGDVETGSPPGSTPGTSLGAKPSAMELLRDVLAAAKPPPEVMAQISSGSTPRDERTWGPGNVSPRLPADGRGSPRTARRLPKLRTNAALLRGGDDALPPALVTAGRSSRSSSDADSGSDDEAASERDATAHLHGVDAIGTTGDGTANLGASRPAVSTAQTESGGDLPSPQPSPSDPVVQLFASTQPSLSSALTSMRFLAPAGGGATDAAVHDTSSSHTALEGAMACLVPIDGVPHSEEQASGVAVVEAATPLPAPVPSSLPPVSVVAAASIPTLPPPVLAIAAAKSLQVIPAASAHASSLPDARADAPAHAAAGRSNRLPPLALPAPQGRVLRLDTVGRAAVARILPQAVGRKGDVNSVTIAAAITHRRASGGVVITAKDASAAASTSTAAALVPVGQTDSTTSTAAASVTLEPQRLPRESSDATNHTLHAAAVLASAVAERERAMVWIFGRNERTVRGLIANECATQLGKFRTGLLAALTCTLLLLLLPSLLTHALVAIVLFPLGLVAGVVALVLGLATLSRLLKWQGDLLDLVDDVLTGKRPLAEVVTWRVQTLFLALLVLEITVLVLALWLCQAFLQSAITHANIVYSLPGGLASLTAPEPWGISEARHVNASANASSVTRGGAEVAYASATRLMWALSDHTCYFASLQRNAEAVAAVTRAEGHEATRRLVALVSWFV